MLHSFAKNAFSTLSTFLPHEISNHYSIFFRWNIGKLSNHKKSAKFLFHKKSGMVLTLIHI